MRNAVWARLLAALTLAACGDPAPPDAEPDRAPAPTELPAAPGPTFSRDAKMDTWAMLMEDQAAPRHPSDGGGRAWLEKIVADDGGDRLRAAGRGRFHLVYEAGPLGVRKGGAVYLQTSPFWDWDTPQTTFPDGPGYTEVRSEAPGVTLDARTVTSNLMIIEIGGRALAPGERIELVFGAGVEMARVDRYAERESRIWLAVDGDGDGVRALLDESPVVDIEPREPARLLLTVPSTAKPGAPFRLAIALVDGLGNAGVHFEGDVVLEAPDGLALPERVSFDGDAAGARSVEGVASREGIYRVRARAAHADAPDLELTAESNPLVVSASAPRVLWADLHGHSQLSDGTGTPDDFFRYARDVAALDVAALTDHDHWGMRPLDRTPELWDRIRNTVARFHAPGRFVTLLGYEWTSWLQGHRHVLYFSDEGEVLSSLDSATDTPARLWAALAGKSALTFAHHSAGGPISTDWNFVPDPEIEPVTEIVSVHGSSEAMDSPGRIYSPVEGNFVRDVLDRGLVFGFIGSGDSHDGHPGLAGLASPSGGLAAIFSEEATRDSVLEGLRARRTYATSGPRIWLRFSVDGRRMGSVLDVVPGEHQELDFAVAATAPIEWIQLVRSGGIVQEIAGEGALDFSARAEIPRLESGEYLYLRVLQEDGGTAWSSPIYAR
ncbi:MAG: CehA/McbA family metallohydrolase [Proteobacteria bacterium]|nr:CehA/McbA family metallohydrolase [Pseudomonadota bacterium]